MMDIVLVGGGHSHVQVLKALAEEPIGGARLTVVVDTPIAVYSGMVPGFVAGQYRAEDLEIDGRPLAEAAGARVIESAAVSVDPSARAIRLRDGRAVGYDLAAFDIGSSVAGLDLPGIRDLALPTRPIGAFVRRIDEVVAAAGEASDRKSPFRVVVVGGGAGGVELAFCLERRLVAGEGVPASVLLIHNRERILDGYPASLARRVERAAARRGIRILCGRRVEAAEGEELLLDDSSRERCNLPVWVTGATAHPLFTDSGLPVDGRGFARTRSTLQVEEHDALLASGDCGTLTEHPGTPKAGVYAVRQGPVLTRNLRALAAGRALERYTPQKDFLTLLNLGDGHAVGAKWGLSFGGRWVMRLKDRIDREFVERFQAGGITPAPSA